MIAAEFAAMGTTISVTAADETGIAATERWFAEVEAVCSRFLPESELTRVNGHAGPRVPLSPLLADVMQAADQVRSLTGGLVDAGVGSDVVRWGYDRTFSQVVDKLHAPAPDALDRRWRLDDGHLIRPSGMRVDLGGIAKGWSADRAIQTGYADIVSAGGDIASAHPDCVVEVLGTDEDVVATVKVGVGALATSSVTRRTWRVAAGKAHHVIDPRTGAPAQTPVLSATVLARTAVAAEAGAKAVLIRGADGLAWAGRQTWIDGAIVVWSDGAVYASTGLDLAA
jgi:thiamine biosynthesis lipoprotein